ncbi:MAG: glycoside hydrolase family 57, partial [Deltaproteobacteria bacterium]
MKPLNIAFLWHMHQPLYKDPFTGEYILPWVRLHGTKDYYDMVAILERFPSLHQTFNIVPSLIEQINDYTDGAASDRFLSLTLKPAADLTRDDKRFIIRNFFLANWEHMIKPLPGYWELLKKRGFYHDEGEMDNALRYFSLQDFLDLQVLFNLAWIDPVIRENDGFLKGLAEKGRGFTEEEKGILAAKQKDIIKQILPKYREMEEKEIIEVTTSPYYHPILPLLCDSYSAKVAMPGIELPQKRFVCAEDAEYQVKSGIKLHEKTFGRKPKGMWPSEGSVSEAIIPIIANEGINWIATDEEILANSLKTAIRRDSKGHCLDPEILYK